MSKLHIKLWERDPLGCWTRKFTATCLCKLEFSSNSLTQEDLWPTWPCWWCAHTARSPSWTSTCWRYWRSPGIQTVYAAQNVGSFSMKNVSQGTEKSTARRTFTGDRLFYPPWPLFKISMHNLITVFQWESYRN